VPAVLLVSAAAFAEVAEDDDPAEVLPPLDEDPEHDGVDADELAEPLLDALSEPDALDEEEALLPDELQVGAGVVDDDDELVCGAGVCDDDDFGGLGGLGGGMPRGLPGSTGGSDGRWVGGPWPVPGVVGSTGTMSPTPLAYTRSSPMTIDT
jgi:hypothetical protein